MHEGPVHKPVHTLVGAQVKDERSANVLASCHRGQLDKDVVERLSDMVIDLTRLDQADRRLYEVYYSAARVGPHPHPLLITRPAAADLASPDVVLPPFPIQLLMLPPTTPEDPLIHIDRSAERGISPAVETVHVFHRVKSRTRR
ncbi:unnamed protein product [Caenorhabditis auriculariae]|uniref:Uncharacterized protein n=1 Tax=Caenorhabditis auriculariae TaxID=2777116 RepID=A0A8S1HRE9_9PELO|nr:unnamed protein product [Caenorhabditis auriculariae]